MDILIIIGTHSAVCNSACLFQSVTNFDSLIGVLLQECYEKCATISYDRGKGVRWEVSEEKDDCLIIKILAAEPCIAQRLPIPS